MFPKIRSHMMKGLFLALFLMSYGPGSPVAGSLAEKRPSTAGSDENPYLSIGDIPLPPGFHRKQAGTNTFAAWLRSIPLKRNKTVYLFNGSPKRNQNAQFAVLDITVGHTDLQQCADAVMRLRAEFLYAQKNFRDINFYTQEGTRLNFEEWIQGKRFKLSGKHLVAYKMPGNISSSSDRACFQDYLNTVFSYCGTLSLENQLVSVTPLKNMQTGDVFIKGGSPGHAMIVVDMAEDRYGQKIYLLAQSYMPAQDIHAVKNPCDKVMSPWYKIPEEGSAGSRKPVFTPEWTFYSDQLRTW